MASPRAKHKLARASLTLLLALAWLAGVPSAARAQAAVQFNDVAAFVSFGEHILFQARIEPLPRSRRSICCWTRKEPSPSTLRSS